jgi:hypothetical protein
MKEFDVIIATDIRFPGGSSGSTLEEIHAQHEAGLRTGIYPLKSPVPGERPDHPGFAAAAGRGECEILAPGADVATKLLLFRHPTVIDHHGGPLPKIDAERVALVINHPPITPAGRVDYLLPYVRLRLRQSYGMEPLIFANGPVLRAALEKYYDGAAMLEPRHWSSVFDLDRFRCERTAPRHPIRIGRHSRSDPEKWPAKAADIALAYRRRGLSRAYSRTAATELDRV